MRFLGKLGLALLVASLTACADRGTDTTRQAAANAAAAGPEPAAAVGTRAPVDALPILGKESALVTVIEFTDYECPYCLRADKTMTALAARYGDDLRFAVAMHPLPFHERARPAALAALAAAGQGKLGAMHARLFAEGRALDEAGLVRAATEAGLDLALFDAARASPETAAALDRAETLAQSLGVKGTPSFVIDGRRVVGAQPLETFVTIIEQELARARTLLAAGTRHEDLYARLLETTPPAPVEPAGAGGGNCTEGECHGPAPEPPLDETPVTVAVDDAPWRGAWRAPVTVAVFSDFQCPFSARVETTLRALEREYPGRVRVSFRNQPLPMHDQARLAAKAALAADEQGKFWEYHDVLFAHQGAQERASLDRYAATLGLDVRRFDRVLDSPETEARVVADETQAARLGVTGTPTVFVNGRRVVGAQPIATFRSAVDRALAEGGRR